LNAEKTENTSKYKIINICIILMNFFIHTHIKDAQFGKLK
jgi:hypothetical protein